MTQPKPVIDGPFMHSENGRVVENILRALPDWFGIEEALIQYRDDAPALPTFYASVNDLVAGFVCIKQHTPYASEVYVMGVLPEYHGQGIGKALIEKAEDWLRERKVEYLQVKTLAATHPDPGYAKTRKFYEKNGFRPLEVFSMLWGEANPCLVMVKRL